MYRIGVDLGGTGIKVAVVDERGALAASASSPTRVSLGAEQVLDDMAQCVMNGLNFAGIEPEECLGVGVGAPGNCDTEAGVVRNAPNLGWENMPVREMLRSRLTLPVFLANDADCAALGEATYGAAKGCGSALFITLGTGVGGGYILDGKLRSGHRSLGGEVGHICVAMDGAPCSCGRRGCWEAYASATALTRQALAAAAAHPESALNATGLPDGKTVYALAKAGDAAAQTVTAQYARYVGVGIVSLINLLFPEIVLLGGGISGAGDALLEPVRDYVRSHCFVRDPALLPELRIAALGSDAGMLGAAALVRQECKD